ncbi:hypothetical protein D8783_08260 [Streptococcus sp. A12]|nr:hypothetical protein D8783_08260 [Streptococcus sp. A12]
MKNSKRFYLYIFIVSLLYAIQYYINNKITPVGDQTAFLKYAEEFQYNYLYFGIDRYFTWSSRLLIESATLFFLFMKNYLSLYLLWQRLYSYYLAKSSQRNFHGFQGS